MNRYLEKIAEKEDNKPGWGKSIAGYLGGTALGVFAAYPIQKHTMNSLLNAHSANMHSTQIGYGTTEKEFLKKHKLDLDIIKEHSHPAGPNFGFGNMGGLHKGNTVHGSSNHGIHMHELGHALDLKNSNIKRHSGINAVAGLGGSALALKGVHDNNSAETIGGTYLSVSPTLKREAMANIHAYNAFKEFEGKGVANKFLKHIALKNTLNYHSPVVLGAAGLVAAQKLIHRHDHDK